ncbi:hypothetical protein ANTQUA_LOCUS4573 [Anthophora quadrimaculata]
MLQKYKKKSFYLDKLHRGFVKICIGATVIGTMLLVMKGYQYYRYVRPALREKARKSNEELLKEGRYIAAST